ncbi:MAG: hypothetical protein ACUVT7_09680 [Thermoplasmata archaeon]
MASGTLEPVVRSQGTSSPTQVVDMISRAHHSGDVTGHRPAPIPNRPGRGGLDVVLYDVSGRKYIFHGMEQANGISKGRLRMIEGLGGARIELFWDGFGKLERVEVKESLDAPACQKWLYTYLAQGPNKGRLEKVEFRRSDGQDPPTYRKAMELTFRYFVSFR